MNRYPIKIFNSEDDEGYIAVAPDLPGCTAFGENEEQALAEIKIAIHLWIETAQGEGRMIPEPTGQEIIERFSADHNVATS